MDEPMKMKYSWNIDYQVTLGHVYTKFFEGLRNKKILGNKCGKCGRVYIPARPFCDICFVEPKEWLEAKPNATVQGFTVTFRKFANLPEPPYITALIKIDNSAVSFLHFLGGIDYKDELEIPDKIQMGMKVEPVWAEDRKGEMLDIKYFKPVKQTSTREKSA